MNLEQLEGRTLLSVMPAIVDLRVDANRDDVINSADDWREDIWKRGRKGRGALILPNFDKDNAGTGAPDNWTGGVWNGAPAAPNNIIDNAADLADVGRIRLAKLGVDDAYNYRVTIQILSPSGDPAWLKRTRASDRVRIFLPTKTSGDNKVLQPGDAAIIGPGLGHTIRFVANPAGANELSVLDLGGNGFFELGVEGLKMGATVIVRLTVEYDPILTDSEPVGEPGGEIPSDPEPVVDEVMIRVAPFVLQDNRRAATRILIENMNDYGLDNADARAVLLAALGGKVVESKTGDIWQQDGYEIGYVQSPYGQMPVILELPRARDRFFDPDHNMRFYIRGTLLAAGVGVSTELAGRPWVNASTFGGDIESLPRPGLANRPGFLVASDMPTYMRQFFQAQGANPLLNLELDDWLSVAHVDEVVHLAPTGDKVLIADTDLAWALLKWAHKVDPDVRLFPGMNSNESLPGYNAKGIPARTMLNNDLFRRQNLEYAPDATRLGGVYRTIRDALKLTEDVSAPAGHKRNTGGAALLRGGAFTAMLGDVSRTFEVRFIDADQYQLRYRDGSAAPSAWFTGRRSRDEIFPEARAFIFKHYWTGRPAAGDTFTWSTNPSATLIRTPLLLGSFDALFPQETPVGPQQPWRLAPFSNNPLNALSDGDTIVTGRAYGPQVNWNGAGAADLFEVYTDAAYEEAGYETIVHADARLYHNSGGGLHCGTNVFRQLPDSAWWR